MVPKGSYGLEGKDPLGKSSRPYPLSKVNLERGNPLENDPKTTSLTKKDEITSKEEKDRKIVAPQGSYGLEGR